MLGLTPEYYDYKKESEQMLETREIKHLLTSLMEKNLDSADRIFVYNLLFKYRERYDETIRTLLSRK